MSDEEKSKKEPALQYAVLCDAVAKDQMEKPVYIGVFGGIEKPMTLPQFIISLRWICGLGEHEFNIKILDPDLKSLKNFKEISMSLKAKTDIFHFTLPVMNFNFQSPGVYWIEISLNKKSYLSIPLPVYEP